MFIFKSFNLVFKLVTKILQIQHNLQPYFFLFVRTCPPHDTHRPSGLAGGRGIAKARTRADDDVACSVPDEAIPLLASCKQAFLPYFTFSLTFRFKEPLPYPPHLSTTLPSGDMIT